ncbi:MAG: helix-turn-helix domain-containing protein [Candidatus Gracilibacteria bacterium]
MPFSYSSFGGNDSYSPLNLEKFLLNESNAVEDLKDKEVNVQSIENLAFNEIIKAVRKAKKITQHDLAIQVDVHQSFIAHIEQGKNFPSDDLTILLAQTLKIPQDILLEKVEYQREIFDATQLVRKLLKKKHIDIDTLLNTIKKEISEEKTQQVSTKITFK